MSAIEKTLVLVKPDGVKKHICGEVISRFERKGLEVEAIKMIQVPEELAKKHYAEHEGKGFFKDLIAFITSGPVLAMVIKGENAVLCCPPNQRRYRSAESCTRLHPW